MAMRREKRLESKSRPDAAGSYGVQLSSYDAEQRSSVPSLTVLCCADKTFGQHFLVNPKIIAEIIDKSELRSTDIVLEIGPGSGVLTMPMLEKVKKVIAIEIDARHVAELRKRVQGGPFAKKLEIIVGDAITLEWPHCDMIVANTPYQISSPLVFKLLAHQPVVRAAVLMFQREFAMRLVAPPGDPMYSRLSVNTQLLAHVEHLIKVGRHNFQPPPKVESSVVRIVPLNPPPCLNFVEFDGLTRLCFSRKNKTLSAIFRQKPVLQLLAENYRTFCALQNVPLPDPLPDMKELVERILSDSGFLEQRSRNLSIDDFVRLLTAFNEAGIHFA